MTSIPQKKTFFYAVELLLFLFVNALFILKYVPRAGINAYPVLGIFCIVVLAIVYLFSLPENKKKERLSKVGFFLLLSLIIGAIIVFLIKVDRYSVNVDRWSAVTFFLDNLFQGNYPYAAHTHVCETNYPSPFPVWYVVNLPFYLMGDVGLGLIFFILQTAFIVHYYFRSWYKSLFFLLLLSISPAYWWEVMVRSDALSNALLVFTAIIWFDRSGKSLSENLVTAILICGLIASTRLSAILPLALYFFRPFLRLKLKQQMIFVSGVALIVILSFLPFILWNTDTWIFFSRNPFMSQSGVGNRYVLTGMIILGIVFSLRWKGLHRFFNTASLFIFIFMALSQLSLILTRGINGSFFSDSTYDVSYFSLILPYCIGYLSGISLRDEEKISEV
ncbi:MAG: hypothetical protein H6Q19_1296 [Bacteroidetes bacterium]|nr:hypothetical protein [Bacteroidota bacterium]